MDKKTLKIALFDELEIKLKPLGFKKRLSKNDFVKKTETGKVAIHFSFVNHEDDFDVILNLAIRIDDLENLANLIRYQLSAKDKNDSFSLGTEIGRFLGEGQKRWTIYTENEISQTVDELFETYIEYGQDYFLKYANLENVYQAICKDDDFSRKLNILDQERAINAVALAIILNKDKSEIESLIESKKAYLLSIKNNFAIKKLDEFIKEACVR